MNKLFKLALSLLAVSAVMISCEGKEENAPASKEVAGLYSGQIVLSLQPDPATPAKIELTQTGDKVRMTLKESSFNAMIEGDVVVIENVNVVKTGANYTVTGSGSVALKGATDQKLNVTVTGVGTPTNMNLVITVQFTPLIIVTFTGARK